MGYDISPASVRPDRCNRSLSMQPDLLHLRATSLPLLYGPTCCTCVPLVCRRDTTRPAPSSAVDATRPVAPACPSSAIAIRPDLLHPSAPRLPSPYDPRPEPFCHRPALVLCRRTPRPATSCVPSLNRRDSHRSPTRANPSCCCCHGCLSQPLASALVSFELGFHT